MSDHEHMPPIRRDTARPMHGGKVIIVIDGRELVKTWDDAWNFAQAIITALEAARP